MCLVTLFDLAPPNTRIDDTWRDMGLISSLHNQPKCGTAVRSVGCDDIHRCDGASCDPFARLRITEIGQPTRGHYRTIAQHTIDATQLHGSD